MFAEGRQARRERWTTLGSYYPSSHIASTHISNSRISGLSSRKAMTTSETAASVNPFLLEQTAVKHEINDSQEDPETPLDTNSEPFYTRVSSPDGEIMKIFINKDRVKPGETLLGTLDFSDAVVLCTQYCVTLLMRNTKPSPKLLPGKLFKDHGEILAISSDFCIGFEATHFEIQVPKAVPKPKTLKRGDSVTLGLRFELVLASRSDSEDIQGPIWKAPAKMDVTTRKWETQIKLLLV